MNPASQPTTLTAAQRQELRHILRAELTARAPAAFNAVQVHRMASVSAPFRVTLEDVTAGLEFLRGLTPPQVAVIQDDLGASQHWHATAAGQLAAERNGEA